MAEPDPARQPLRLTTEALVQPGLLLSKFLDLLFPPRCTGCGRVDLRWCDRCTADLLATPVLMIGKTDGLEIIATGQHRGKLRRAVHALKYDHEPRLAALLAQRLAERLEAQQWTIDILIPVPLHATREQGRGYNQANLLAQQLSNRIAVLCASNGLKRTRDTRSQVGLDHRQRQENMRSAFTADPSLVAGKAVAIIDDVCTTGATLDACADAALVAGARSVYGLTVTVA